MIQSTRYAACRKLMMTTAVGLALVAPGAALAQQQGSAPKAAASDTSGEIVVTAQKRTENLQRVPVSAEVVTGATLAKQNLDNLVDLSDTVPGIQVRAGPGTTKLYVRGVGSGTGSAFDQSVGTFIDDVYHGRSKGDLSSFLDVERVEILKGPQGTYFGNSAIAGAINVVTNKSDAVFNGNARALYGEFGQYALEAAVGGPLGNGFGLRIAGIANGETGWLKSTTTGATEPDGNNFTGRATLTYSRSEDFDAALKVEAGSMRQSGVLLDQIYHCPATPNYPANAGFCGLAIAGNVPLNPNSNKFADTPGENMFLYSNEDALTMNYHKWGQTFTSVTGYYNYRFNQQYDPTGTPTTTNGLGVQNPEDYRQFSQEFRISSPTGQTFEYLAGVYYQTDHLNLGAEQNLFFLTPKITAAIPALIPYLPLGQNITLGQNENSYAAFGALTWNATDKLKITGGLRDALVNKNYVWNEYYGTATSEYSGLVPLPAAVAALPGGLGTGRPGTQNGSRSDHALTPSVRVQYQVDPKAMVYFSYANGFKAGGFVGNPNNATGSVTASPNAIDFNPEHVDAYEVGLKSQWFDNRVLLDLAVFRSNYRSLQVAQNQPTTAGTFVSNVTNVGASLAQGVEFNLQWVINDNFRISTVGSYLDSHYVHYTGDALTSAQTLAYNQCVTASGKVACAPLATQDLSGGATILAPKWSGSVTGAYQTLIGGDYHLAANLTAIYSTSYFLEATDDPLIEAPGYVRVDAGLTIESPDRRWAVDLIGKNLTDQNIRYFGSQQTQSLGSILMTKEEPRNVAIQLRYHW
jgi:iron complex outermembrane receptor protein